MLNLSYNSPFKNLALEETLAHSTLSEEFRPTLRLWVDPPAVIMGRFQDVASEVDTTICDRNNVQIARRFTGGGAVFHDEGNLNFTVVTKRTKRISLTKLHEINSSIIMHTLSKLGAKVSFSPPNTILVSGRKISGAAAALGNHFTLWHSAILISTNTDLLERVLSPSREVRSTRFVRSRWQPVTTLQASLGKLVSMEEVRLQLTKSVERVLGVTIENGDLRSDEKMRFELLHARKYSSSDWNLRGDYKENEKGRVTHTTIAV